MKLRTYTLSSSSSPLSSPPPVLIWHPPPLVPTDAGRTSCPKFDRSSLDDPRRLPMTQLAIPGPVIAPHRPRPGPRHEPLTLTVYTLRWPREYVDTLRSQAGRCSFARCQLEVQLMWVSEVITDSFKPRSEERNINEAEVSREKIHMMLGR